jgi:hypothetical protein
MIRQDYQVYFQQLKSKLSHLGYLHVVESKLGAEFYLSSGWIVEFDCEPYYGPSWTISITNKKSEKSGNYAVWILMRAFEKITGATYGKPTLDNQVNFLIKEKERIFDNPAFYDEEYTKLNNIT